MTTCNNDNVRSNNKISLANENVGDPTYLVGEGTDQLDSGDDAVDATANDLVTESIDTESIDSDDTLDVLLPPLSMKVQQNRHEAFAVSRQDGRMMVAAPIAIDLGKAKNNNDKEIAEKELSAENSNSNSTEWDSWETVEVRSRNSRKKPSPPSPPPPSPNIKQTPHSSSATIVNESHKVNSKKSKGGKHNGAQRKKGIALKIVGDIINSVIDSIDDEAKKLRQLHITSYTRPVNSWKNGPPGVIHKLAVGNNGGTVGGNGSVNRETTLRDVLIGKSAAAPSVANKAVTRTALEMDNATASSFFPNKSNDNDADKSMRKTDQNTAPTYQDTSSSSSNALLGSKEEPQNIVDRKCDTSSSDLEEAPQNIEGETSSKLDTADTSTPPLPTLLSPENANSATSSVASSLEAPPRGRNHHHSDTVKDVNDVGYHLLDVCDRLSRDMSLFMSRRTLALTARRRERGAILSALQSSVASIWPERCRVELYGSCATQLDLPSSDIDVVVLGAQRNSYVSSQISTSRNSSNTGNAIDESYLNNEIHHQNIQHLVPTTSPYGMLPQHRNAEKVVKLAADLEKQPWAVQVNAIPTASVPVIKVLADPSKLVCSSIGTDWVTTHQIAGNGAPISGGVEALENRPSPEYSKADSGSYPPPTHVPWRGSDVMKGLLSLDITFEGPEHGGIGSTEFSTKTVREACEESGLHPDSTPFVQTLMVLKELLAQRKLNEPYSGGLSSYALLLLVLALVRERTVIREEIELVEQQRRAMSIGELSSFLNGSITSSELTPLSVMQPTLTLAIDSKSAEVVYTPPSKPKDDNMNDTNDDFEPEAISPDGKSRNLADAKPSSWAMVAKMNSGSKATSVAAKINLDAPLSKTNETPSEALALKPSFADAVSGTKKKTNVTPSSKTRNEKMTGKVKSQDKTSDQTIEAESKKEVPSEATPPVCNSAMKVTSNASSNVSPIDKKTRAPAFYPQGYNDIVEVLCSGETTAGKLLMHFLLYYGQHFDAQSTAIDISGKHERLYDGPNSYRTPYIQRKSLGNIDPITGMLTVDPIVIYDPLEGSENNNVSRRCFAWNSVRWIFAQSYATLASAVERSATPPTTPNGGSIPQAVGRDSDSGSFVFSPDSNCDLMDPSSPLLRCLLSF
jgi:DNA polymerase sigma